MPAISSGTPTGIFPHTTSTVRHFRSPPASVLEGCPRPGPQSAVYRGKSSAEDGLVIPVAMERPNRALVRRLLAVLLAIGGAVVAARAADPTPEQRSLWSLRPVRPVSVPATMDVKTSAHPIDAFIDATLAARGIRPVPTADRATLLRRASLDLSLIHI